MSDVPTPRYARPDSEVTQVYRSRLSGRGDDAPRYGLARVLAGVVLAVLVLLLGLIAKAGPIASLDLLVDQHIAAHDRTSAFTALARAATTIATPETIGIGLMIVVPLILLVASRRLDALKVFCMFAGAFALAEIGKKLIGEHRPPMSLWAMKADSGASYPSGHATTAAVLAVALVVVAATFAGRGLAFLLGTVYAVAVAASRVYLADHYPLDVVGSVLCALAAAFIVTGLAALPAVHQRLRRLESRRGRQ
jgi:undecaprenyl-diphosphatase